MKTTTTTTGIIRRIDDLGRIVIPKELRRKAKIKEGSPLEIYITEEGICLKPYNPEPKSNTELAEEWLKDYKDYIESFSPIFNINGNTTTCEVIEDDERRTGEAKCNPCDNFSPAVGMMLSFYRAIDCCPPFELES